MSEKQGIYVARNDISERAGLYLTKRNQTIAFQRMYVDIMGSVVGALWLSQLAYWQPRAGRSDGFVYKSYKEWQDETGLSQYQVKKAADKAVEMGVVERELKRANGAPTLHYRIDHSRLTAVINSIIKKLDNRETSQSDYEETKQSLTETTQKLHYSPDGEKNPTETDDKRESDDFLSELNARKADQPVGNSVNITDGNKQNLVSGIGWAIAADRPVTSADMEATRGETIEGRLAGWQTNERVKDVVRAFSEAFHILPPEAPRKKGDKSAATKHYWAWIAGAENLLNISGHGDVCHIVREVARDYDGFDGIVSPASIERAVYKKRNALPEQVSKYTLGNEIGV